MNSQTSLCNFHIFFHRFVRKERTEEMQFDEPTLRNFQALISIFFQWHIDEPAIAFLESHILIVGDSVIAIRYTHITIILSKISAFLLILLSVMLKHDLAVPQIVALEKVARNTSENTETVFFNHDFAEQYGEENRKRAAQSKQADKQTNKHTNMNWSMADCIQAWCHQSFVTT